MRIDEPEGGFEVEWPNNDLISIAFVLTDDIPFRHSRITNVI